MITIYTARDSKKHWEIFLFEIKISEMILAHTWHKSLLFILQILTAYYETVSLMKYVDKNDDENKGMKHYFQQNLFFFSHKTFQPNVFCL